MTKLHTLEKIACEARFTISRTKVPGGWLYITHTHAATTAVSTTFVADSEDTKEVVAPSKTVRPRGIRRGTNGQFEYHGPDDKWHGHFMNSHGCSEAYVAAWETSD